MSGLTHHGGTERDLIDRERVDLDRNRQVWQAERGGLCLGQGGVVGDGQARDVEAGGSQAFHLQTAPQQGRAVPDQRRPFKRQPNAVIIRNGHPVKGGGRTQRACKAVNADGATRAAEHVLQGTGQEALVFFLLRKGRCPERKGEQNRQREV